LLLNIIYIIIVLLDTCSLPRYRWDQLLVLAGVHIYQCPRWCIFYYNNFVSNISITDAF